MTVSYFRDSKGRTERSEGVRGPAANKVRRKTQVTPVSENESKDPG